MATTNVSIRMDTELKKEADAIFADMGMNISTAFNIFVRQVLRTGAIPFEIAVNRPNARTLAAMEEAERISKDPDWPSYSSAEELFAALEAEEVEDN